MQKVYNLKKKSTFFKNRFCFQDIVFFFSFEMSIYFKSHVYRLYFLLVFAICGVFEHVIILTI